MKLFILFALITATVSIFAHSRYSMTKNDVRIMNEVIDAMDTKEVRLFTENATFESVSVQYSPDGKTAHFEMRGTVLMEGDIDCGELYLTLDRKTLVQNEATWNTYKAKLDTSRLADYCELKYRDAIR